MKIKYGFNINSLAKKLGENPSCYLTGIPINLYDISSYEFDHIIPVSRGGPNTLDNLGVCIKRANQSKSDMMLPEYIQLCQDVLTHHGFKVSSPSSS